MRSQAHALAMLARHAAPFDAVVLGMGADAHIASLFPGAPDLGRAIDPSGPMDISRIDPEPLPPEAPFPRMTLTAARLLRTRSMQLVITGERKREALRRAEATNDPVMRQTAQLRAAYIAAETQDFDAMQTRLRPLTAAEGRISYLARELLAVEAWEAGQLDVARDMLGMTLVTHQTGPEGKVVKRILVEKGCNIARELYVSLLADRKTSRVTMMASTEGGMDIEEVAAKTPEKVFFEQGQWRQMADAEPAPEGGEPEDSRTREGRREGLPGPDEQRAGVLDRAPADEGAEPAARLADREPLGLSGENNRFGDQSYDRTADGRFLMLQPGS